MPGPSSTPASPATTGTNPRIKTAACREGRVANPRPSYRRGGLIDKIRRPMRDRDRASGSCRPNRRDTLRSWARIQIQMKIFYHDLDSRPTSVGRMWTARWVQGVGRENPAGAVAVVCPTCLVRPLPLAQMGSAIRSQTDERPCRPPPDTGSQIVGPTDQHLFPRALHPGQRAIRQRPTLAGTPARSSSWPIQRGPSPACERVKKYENPVIPGRGRSPRTRNP
jgi:hypothetical protein